MKQGTESLVKFKELQRAMNFRQWQAIGLLESLWMFTARNAVLGDIGRFTDEQIALGMDYAEDPGEMIQMLVKTGWLNRSERFRLVVHDWHDHSPDFVKKRVERSKTGEQFASRIEQESRVANRVSEDGRGWIYFIQAASSGEIKIGFTGGGIEFRHRDLQCWNPQELCLLGAMRGKPVDERNLHVRFSQSKVRGEWFRPDEELLNFIHKETKIPDSVQECLPQSATVQECLPLSKNVCHQNAIPEIRSAERVTKMSGFVGQSPPQSKNVCLPSLVKPSLAKPSPVQPNLEGGSERCPELIGKPPVRFNAQTGQFEGIPEIMRQAWSEAFPGVDLDREIAKAAAWVLTNLASGGRKSRYDQFLNRWLTKAQNQAGTGKAFSVERNGQPETREQRLARVLKEMGAQRG